ncbi:metal-sulfur cluster assembly factor [Limosilactobacillus sp. STM2_1]|uniref:Metal-sulfur cluster assembly factor n=1 Tax=Limosilactobacillus rudii TaxID=2759755 RepID=A0A7W3UMD7_9LACO|nr:metal-sulfur cluster assembly factor [Limosilactobacillus rudii]MBB1078896.1 metal-sulfur cluster assembly factor [Limosilactobacillus rudii]MBB1098228.1 metal-sulfur cluster assembly factor [Limosilactobacillus rudii]MCD7135657.1 metal-sulfur cluster assembly factor [Limosilactobacillus rudii]
MENSEIVSKVTAALENVIDPELGIDIVNLGLIYGVEVDDNGHCQINMTLTTPGCPLSDVLNQDIQKQVSAVQGITDVEIKLVWYPVWTMNKMSQYAKIALGVGGV